MNNIFTIDINLGSLKTSNSFLKIMSKELYFPEYFGFNYNALDECMQDLSWIPENEIIINFKHLDRLKEKNQPLYDVIYDCLNMYQDYWKKNKSRKKVIIKF